MFGIKNEIEKQIFIFRWQKWVSFSFSELNCTFYQKQMHEIKIRKSKFFKITFKISREVVWILNKSNNNNRNYIISWHFDKIHLTCESAYCMPLFRWIFRHENTNYYAHNDGTLFLVLDRTSEWDISDGFSACDQLKIKIMIARAVVSKSHKPVCGFLFESWISILLWLKYHYQYQNRARHDRTRAPLQMWW